MGSCRYLNKLCDQLVCLLSSEHSKALVWHHDDNDKANKESKGESDDDDEDGASTDSEKSNSGRFVSFEVAKTNDQEENVAVRAGFVVRHSVAYGCVTSVTQIFVRYKMNSPLLVDQAPPPDSDTYPKLLFPALLHGEKVQGFMTATFMQATKVVDSFSYDGQTAQQMRLRL